MHAVGENVAKYHRRLFSTKQNDAIIIRPTCEGSAELNLTENKRDKILTARDKIYGCIFFVMHCHLICIWVTRYTVPTGIDRYAVCNKNYHYVILQ